MKITFIVVGKDESKTLNLTFDSILKYIEINTINEFEIIYVDSNSKDNSIEIARKYKFVKIFLITSKPNSAIARNIGAENAKGEILYFLDADMEINPQFFNNIFKENKLIHPFISGQLENIFYDKNWNFLEKSYLFKNLNDDCYVSTNGGYFIITKELWNSVGGMKNKYRRSQDIDLTLRIAKNGVLLLRKKEIFVKHHTINYNNKARIWKMLFDGSILYQSSILFRDHLLNKHFYKDFFRKQYTLFILFCSILLSFFSIEFLLIHPLTVFLRSYISNKAKGDSPRIIIFLNSYLKDIFSLCGIFFFFPNYDKIKYKAIK